MPGWTGTRAAPPPERLLCNTNPSACLGRCEPTVVPKCLGTHHTKPFDLSIGDNRTCGVVTPQAATYGVLMTHARPWPAELTRATGRAIRHYRRERHMSAEQLAEAVSALGLRYTRTQVTNLESGRRDSVTAGEVFAFAAALDVAAALLLLPLGSDEPVEVVPGHSTDAWTAYRWLLGEMPTSELGKQPQLDITWFAPPVTAAYRRHDNGLRSYLHYKGGDGALATIAGARVEMQQEGWWRPPLPDEVTEAIRPVLLAFGWREDPPGELSRVPGADVSEGAS